MNPKQMQTMLKRMGIKVEQIEAMQVIIKGADEDIVINDPQVMLTKMPNQEMFQISGKVEYVEAGSSDGDYGVKVEITDEDIEMVAEQAGVSKKQAKEALVETEGDIAEAIMKLKG